jgi:hypothetical protein
MRNTLFLAILASTALNAQVNFTSQNISMPGQYRNCIVDMNGDYLDDIISVSSNRIYINLQNADGSFTLKEYSTSNSPYMPGWSITAGDFNGDGYNDLMYGSGSGVAFAMSDFTSSFGYGIVYGNQYVFSQRGNFIDINNDGNLDAYMCHDVEPSVYYINENNVPVFHQGGLGDYPTGGHYGSIWVDYNNDGLMDLFIAKCGSTAGKRINELHRNNGDGTFTNVAPAANLDSSAENWSTAWGDFNNDGWLDLFNGINAQMQSEVGNHELMRNNGDGTFTNVTAGSGFDDFNGKSREHHAYDFDNDGFLDIAGNSNKIFYNDGGEEFHFTPANAPFSDAAFGDLNNDGFIDAYFNNTIYYNQGNNNNWIKITTKGTESNTNGIGARVELYSDLGMQIREVRAGQGFAFMSTLNTHFGIGTDTEIEKIIVRWPSGIVDTIFEPQINTTLHIVEGQHQMGVTDLDRLSFAVYPNPVKDILNLKADSMKNASYEIRDLAGALVMKGDAQTGKINVQQLNKGVYVMTFIQNGQKTHTKFIKQ